MRALRVTAAALLLGSTALLAGCSPPGRVYSAVYLSDGVPTVVVRLCDGKDRPTAVTVREVPDAAPSASTGPSESTALRWDAYAPADETRRFGEIRLLDPPPGWSLQPGNQSPLAGFVDGQRYRASIDISGPTSGDDSGAMFTVGDLRSLRSGEVWARSKPYGSERAMTRDEFRRAAKDTC
jgi:hypothetical protein